MVCLSYPGPIGRNNGGGSLQPAADHHLAGDVPFRLKRDNAARFAPHRDRFDADPPDKPSALLDANEAAALDWIEHLFYSDTDDEFVEVSLDWHMVAYRPVIIYGCH